jgi:hypothetical protein
MLSCTLELRETRESLVSVMKNDKSIKMISDLRELVDRWERELDVKPLWWRKRPELGSGKHAANGTSGTGALTTEAPRRTKIQSQSPRVVVRERKAPSNRSHRRATKVARSRPADQAADRRT